MKKKPSRKERGVLAGSADGSERVKEDEDEKKRRPKGTREAPYGRRVQRATGTAEEWNAAVRPNRWEAFGSVSDMKRQRVDGPASRRQPHRK